MRKYTVAYIVAVIVWFAFLVYTMTTPVSSASTEQQEAPVVIASGNLAGDDTPAAEPKTYADIFRETANAIPDCKITYYCAEEYEHICGTGDGITATGAPVTPYWTCAVDPDVIPLGSDVLVDYGDGELHYYRADDIGGAVKGNHIDVCVTSHEEAQQLGITSAVIYWVASGEVE